MTVVAAELWINPVTSAPSRTPRNTLLVSRSNMPSRRPLDSFSKPSVMVDMPKRKVAMAPMRVITSVIFTCLPPNLTSLSNCVRGGRNDAPGTKIERIASLPQYKLYPCFP